jgi:hypothetical protein
MDDNHPGECSRPLHVAVEDDDSCAPAAAAAAQAKLLFSSESLRQGCELPGPFDLRGC